ncbi:MAG: hypothetical protein WCD20_02640 [Rhodomicrobium sp.]
MGRPVAHFSVFIFGGTVYGHIKMIICGIQQDDALPKRRRLLKGEQVIDDIQLRLDLLKITLDGEFMGFCKLKALMIRS